MSISDKQLRALHNLADKQAGQDVDWISIADARALTEQGLARRTRSGWEITPEGSALIKEHPPTAELHLVPRSDTKMAEQDNSSD